jgi:hypothetical protein
MKNEASWWRKGKIYSALRGLRKRLLGERRFQKTGSEMILDGEVESRMQLPDSSRKLMGPRMDKLARDVRRPKREV